MYNRQILIKDISRQTEYKERRLLPAQKLKRLFLLQQIMGLFWQLGTTGAKRTPSRTIWQLESGRLFEGNK
jgi:hypothetical protein